MTRDRDGIIWMRFELGFDGFNDQWCYFIPSEQSKLTSHRISNVNLRCQKAAMNMHIICTGFSNIFVLDKRSSLPGTSTPGEMNSTKAIMASAMKSLSEELSSVLVSKSAQIFKTWITFLVTQLRFRVYYHPLPQILLSQTKDLRGAEGLACCRLDACNLNDTQMMRIESRI